MDAHDWLAHSLGMGSRFSSLVAQDLHRVSGWEFLGDALGQEPTDFHESGRGGNPVERSIRLTSYFRERLEDDPDRLVLVENMLARRGDPHLPAHSLFVDENVVLWEPLASDPGNLLQLLGRAGSGWVTNAFIGASGIETGSSEPRDLEGEPLRRLAASVEHIIVSVFDGEGYVAYQLRE